MDEKSPPQQEGRDSEGDTAAATKENETVKMKIEEALEEMKPLPGRISELVVQHRARRRHTSADDPVLRYYEFVQVELSGIVASLNQIYSLPEPLGPDYAHENFLDWLGLPIELASLTTELRSGQAASCFSCAARLSLPGIYKAPDLLRLLITVTESPFRYKHIMGNDDEGDRTSSTSYPYTIKEGFNVLLVGIEETLRNKQLRWFMADDGEAENKTLKVMSMVGPVGVGKTTLAMKVYSRLQQIQIQGGHPFQCCIRVKVSHRPNMIELLKHILSQIVHKHILSLIVHKSKALAFIQPSQITTQQQQQELLAHEVSQCLQDKRYIIVIDDIRKDSDWHIIKNAFPCNRLGSRIIATTQLRSVAQLCSSHSTDGLVHEVKPLSQLHSKSLFFRYDSDSDDSFPPENLRQVCDEILRRCEGIPLFINGMAYLWRDQQEELQHISTSYSTEIISKLPKQIQQALSNTYYDLTGMSKALLMNMSMFCEGHLFEKDSLLLKWMLVQGMIGPHVSFIVDTYAKYRYRFFNNAERCLSELIDRNIITSVRGHIPQVEGDYLQVNYFMQQFIASKSADLGLAFTSSTLTSVVAQGKKLGRRLYLHQPADPQLPNLLTRMDLSQTRLLTISGEVKGIPLDRFTYLVVLDLEGWQCLKDEDMLRICKMFLLQYLSLKKTTGISKLPPEIKELQLLHTLDISHTSICEIPSQVCELQWLETLDVRSTPVRQLPERIGNMDRLKWLLINGEGVKCEETVTVIPERVGQIPSLETLATVDLSGCFPSVVEALGGLEDLQVLAITWTFHQCTDNRFQEALRACIGKWRRLESLTILCGLGCCMDFLDSLPGGSNRLQKFKVPGGRFGRIPQWFNGLNYLTFIEITVCRLDPKEDLSILRNLPELERLVLGLHFIPEAAIVIDEIGFDQLKRFSVSCRVPWLSFNEGAMKELTFFQLKIAGSLASQESVPSGIYNLKSLSEVAICYHANYTNSPSVKRTIEAVRKGVYKHRMPINLFINDIEDQRH